MIRQEHVRKRCAQIANEATVMHALMSADMQDEPTPTQHDERDAVPEGGDAVRCIAAVYLKDGHGNEFGHQRRLELAVVGPRPRDATLTSALRCLVPIIILHTGKPACMPGRTQVLACWSDKYACLRVAGAG